MNSKTTYNLCMLLLVVATIGLASKESHAAVGTGLLAFIFVVGHLIDEAPRN